MGPRYNIYLQFGFNDVVQCRVVIQFSIIVKVIHQHCVIYVTNTRHNMQQTPDEKFRYPEWIKQEEELIARELGNIAEQRALLQLKRQLLLSMDLDETQQKVFPNNIDANPQADLPEKTCCPKISHHTKHNCVPQKVKNVSLLFNNNFPNPDQYTYTARPQLSMQVHKLGRKPSPKTDRFESKLNIDSDSSERKVHLDGLLLQKLLDKPSEHRKILNHLNFCKHRLSKYRLNTFTKLTCCMNDLITRKRKSSSNIFTLKRTHLKLCQASKMRRNLNNSWTRDPKDVPKRHKCVAWTIDNLYVKPEEINSDKQKTLYLAETFDKDKNTKTKSFLTNCVNNDTQICNTIDVWTNRNFHHIPIGRSCNAWTVTNQDNVPKKLNCVARINPSPENVLKDVKCLQNWHTHVQICNIDLSNTQNTLNRVKKYYFSSKLKSLDSKLVFIRKFPAPKKQWMIYKSLKVDINMQIMRYMVRNFIRKMSAGMLQQPFEKILDLPAPFMLASTEKLHVHKGKDNFSQDWKHDFNQELPCNMPFVSQIVEIIKTNDSKSVSHMVFAPEFHDSYTDILLKLVVSTQETILIANQDKKQHTCATNCETDDSKICFHAMHIRSASQLTQESTTELAISVIVYILKQRHIYEIAWNEHNCNEQLHENELLSTFTQKWENKIISCRESIRSNVQIQIFVNASENETGKLVSTQNTMAKHRFATIPTKHFTYTQNMGPIFNPERIFSYEIPSPQNKSIVPQCIVIITIEQLHISSSPATVDMKSVRQAKLDVGTTYVTLM